jgi:TolB-like protein/DNA-binding winged helix-turn-helix (wHTH) protein/Tfp pilus assembly protein PilF
LVLFQAIDSEHLKDTCSLTSPACGRLLKRDTLRRIIGQGNARMATAPSQDRVRRFGVFEVDLQAGELRKSGMRQKLADQPFQVLQILLERPHEIVTRVEFRDRLWPDGTSVDHDLALKKAVNRLREVLGDSAETPRFIETVHRRGYRFIAPLDNRPESTEQQASSLPRHREPGRKAAGYVLAFLLVAVTATLALLSATDLGHVRERVRAMFGESRIESLAVLPLHNLSRDPEQEYFADGMTDELITDLAKFSKLRVISHTSVERYKQTEMPLPEIARELGVEAVVEGTVVRSGDRVRITVQLVQAVPEKHLLAESYERNVRDLLTLQDEMAHDIAAEIRVKLTPQDQSRLADDKPIDAESYEAYLKGVYYYEKLSIPGFQEGRRYFQQAVERDPNYAPAYLGLANAYKELGVWGALRPREASSQAKAAVEKALALDETLGEAHATLGHIYFLWDWDWAAADREYKRALELGPPSSNTRIQCAIYLSAMGRHDEAIAQMRQGHDIDPISQPTNNLLGFIYFLAHRFDDAIGQYKKTLILYPDSAMAHLFLGASYERKGMYQEAVEEYLKTKAIDGAKKEELETYRNAFLRSGMKGFLHEEIKSTLARSKHQYVSAPAIASWYARLGEKDKALEWLEKAYQEGAHNMVFIRVDPALDSLHSDPRFQDLLRRMDLVR